jgi:hypothetical protein
MIAAAVAIFGVLAWYERRKADPLVVPSLFRKRGFSGGLLVGLLLFSGIAGFSLVFTLYLQLGLGYSPLKAGLTGMPWSIGVMAGFGVAQAAQRFGRKVLHGGALGMIVGMVAVGVTLHVAGTDVTPWRLAPALVVTGVGMGSLMAPFFDIVLAAVEPHETGSAGGTLAAVQQLGSALGLALLGTLFFGILPGHVASAARESKAVPVRLTSALADCGHDQAAAKDPQRIPASCVRLGGELGAAPAPVRRAVSDAGRESARRGFGDAMTITLGAEVGLLGLTFLAAFLLPRRARPEK